MADDLKKIKNLVETAVKKINKLDKRQVTMSEQLVTMDKQQATMSRKLDHIEERQDGHTASLMNIEATLKGYADMYKVNKGKNEEIEERVNAIEDQLGASKNN